MLFLIFVRVFPKLEETLGTICSEQLLPRTGRPGHGRVSTLDRAQAGQHPGQSAGWAPPSPF